MNNENNNNQMLIDNANNEQVQGNDKTNFKKGIIIFSILDIFLVILFIVLIVLIVQEYNCSNHMQIYTNDVHARCRSSFDCTDNGDGTATCKYCEGWDDDSDQCSSIIDIQCETSDYNE